MGGIRITRWAAIYFALAMIDVMTIMGSLALNHHTVSVHRVSVEQSQVWAGHLMRATELAGLAQRVNAPGNDVFDTGNSDAERARRDAALDAFWTGYATLSEGVSGLSQETLDGIQPPLDQIRPAMQGMVLEADQIFALIGQGDMAAAGRHMATMDRKYADLTTAIGALSAQIQLANSAQLSEELDRASALQRWEYVFGAIVLLIITLVAIYGHRMGMVMDRKDRELREARDDAERANRQKSEFLANMSHEIRTPLNGVLGMAASLDRADLCEEDRKSVRIIRESGDHLMATINDILDLSKIESGQLETENTRFCPQEEFDRIQRLYTLRARDAGVEFSCSYDGGFDPKAHRIGDPTRLAQILHNLISNAVKFTERGEVSVRVEPVTGEPDWISVSVKDTGCGMSPAQLSRIFDPFVQAETSTTRRFGGTGLGLAIVNQLVELMGGHLTVDSQLHQGSCFSVSLPLPLVEGGADNPAEEDLPEAEDSGPNLPEGLKILVVDDNLTNRLVAAGLLAQIKPDVTFAQDGLEAIMATRTARFDLILMDINMPNLDGFEALRLIRAWQEEGLSEHTMIFALTASLMAEQVQEYKTAGFDGLLAKPLQQDVLLETVRVAIKGGPGAGWQGGEAGEEPQVRRTG